MKLTFIGADREVTGSLHLLEACGIKVAIDMGMEQGQNPFENAPMPIKYIDLDYIILTHAHIDHAGMIPLAFKNGFTGTVLCTEATEALANIMLRDSAYIQESEAEYKSKKALRAGKKPVEPVYDVNDALVALENFRSVPYGQTVELADGFTVKFTDAGHLLGSASAEIRLEENGVKKTIVFSGDIGNYDKPLIRNPQYIKNADFVVMESTYGDRNHERVTDHIEELTRIIQSTLDRGGNVLLPAFAVGRTQELLYFIRKIKADGLVKGHDNFPVYVDSPLAVEATRVFRENLLECYDDETRALVEKGINPIDFSGLKLSVTSDESKAINFDKTPKVIISASGMCDAGRIRHHLKHNLWRAESTVVFAGYQANGTLGRVLLDGEKTVKLFGEEITVRAHIETMSAMSSHADQNGLLDWVSAFENDVSRVFLVHGDDDAMKLFAPKVEEKTGFKTEMPSSGSVFDLAENRWIVETQPIPRTKEAFENKKNTAYEKLVAAYNKLLSAVRANKDGTNKDLAKFTDQILNLHDKWIR